MGSGIFAGRDNSSLGANSDAVFPDWTTVNNPLENEVVGRRWPISTLQDNERERPVPDRGATVKADAQPRSSGARAGGQSPTQTGRLQLMVGSLRTITS